jgi:hypothetical protein
MKKIVLSFVGIALFVFTTKNTYAQNVGIGETNPNSRLEVKGETDDNTKSIVNFKSNNGTSRFFLRNDGLVRFSILGGTGTRIMTTNPTGDLGFLPTGTAGQYLRYDGTWAALSPSEIPNLDASKITSGVFSTARLGTGTPNNTVFLRGDGTWAAVPSSADNLGNHTATTTLDMGTNYISRVQVNSAPYRTDNASFLSGSYTNNEAAIHVFNGSDGSAPYIAFHRGGVYGANFGLDVDNQFAFGGWSAGTGFTGVKTGNLTVNGQMSATGHISNQTSGGYVFTTHLNANSGLEDPGSYTVQGFPFFSSDNYMRKASAAHIRTALGITAPNGDNLGNHTATTTLNMGTNYISRVQVNSAPYRTNNASFLSGSYTNNEASIHLDNGGDGSAPYIAFHRQGLYAANFGLDVDNQFAFGGWSAGTGFTGVKTGNLTVNGQMSATGNINAAGQITATGHISNQPSGGYVFTTHLNANSGLEDPGSYTVQGFPFFSSDNYMRKASAAHIRTALGITAPNGDNLGNHTATTTLNMGANYISKVQVNSAPYRTNNATFLSPSYTNNEAAIHLDNGGDGSAPYIAFHRQGLYAANFGLDVDNQFAFGGWSAGTGYAGVKTGNLTVTGNIGATGVINTTGYKETSDVRWKKNISSIANPLEKVMALKGVNYYFKTKAELLAEKQDTTYNFTDKKQIGFIAQEVEKVLPEVVSTDPVGYKTVEYSKVVSLLVEAVKEQQKEIEALKNENASLKAQADKVKVLEDKMQKVEALLEQATGTVVKK